MIRPVDLIPLAAALLAAPPVLAQRDSGMFNVRDFRFTSGETLPEVRLFYRTLGRPQRDAAGVVRNAVLILHGTGGTGAQFFSPLFTPLYRAGGPLDTSRTFVILPDDVGHGRSSKPSDGLRARFPHYGYQDMVALEYRLVTEGLHVDHLRIVMGTSMGGMHTWLWGVKYPQAMDALVPMASQPTEMGSRNWMLRRIMLDTIRNDPDYNGGNYTSQPRMMKYAITAYGIASAGGTLALAALLTAFYTMRQITLTFLGEPRTKAAEHARETPWTMTLPLVVLAIFAIGASVSQLCREGTPVTRAR